jgi:voltage-gated potassium channel
MPAFGPSHTSDWRERLHQIIFEADTPAGKVFDVALLIAISTSVVAVSLESVAAFQREHAQTLRVFDVVVTVLFTVEYILRLVAVDRPLRYATSFYGVIDLVAIVPGFVSFLFPGAQSLLVIRAVRLLRVFRVLKLGHYLSEAQVLSAALRASKNKITVFLGAVAIITVIMGALMYLIEGEDAGFTSIPRGVYWAIVTMTTVGYGDIAPQTALGQILAAILMVSGYGIIAVPTGIVTMELVNANRQVTTQACKSCTREGHEIDAVYCKYCGEKL